MNKPKLSIVMSVFNGQDTLKKTINSILDQTFSGFEFIIVNDGSTDRSKEMLERACANDSRITLIHQENKGITQALINGCQIAKADIIARQDNGDISFTKRLESQLNFLIANPETVMISCGTQFVGPLGEHLYTVIQNKVDAEHGLKKENVGEFRGPPHHGSMMFRRKAYEKVGGYRVQFKVAQDIDLWSRLINLGHHHSLQTVLYQASISKGSISMRRRDQQVQTTQTVIDCIKARRVHGNDSSIIEDLIQKNQQFDNNAVIDNDASFYYFLGSNLFASDIASSQKYLRLALQSKPLHAKARIKLLAAFFLNLIRVILKR